MTTAPEDSRKEEDLCFGEASPSPPAGCATDEDQLGGLSRALFHSRPQAICRADPVKPAEVRKIFTVLEVLVEEARMVVDRSFDSRSG